MSSPPGFSEKLQQNAAAYAASLARRPSYKLWWDDADVQKSVYLGDFSSIAQLFELVEDRVGLVLGHVYYRTVGQGIVKKEYSRDLYVRSDGCVFCGVISKHRGFPEVPLDPTETEYPFVARSAGKNEHKFTRTRLPFA